MQHMMEVLGNTYKNQVCKIVRIRQRMIQLGELMMQLERKKLLRQWIRILISRGRLIIICLNWPEKEFWFQKTELTRNGNYMTEPDSPGSQEEMLILQDHLLQDAQHTHQNMMHHIVIKNIALAISRDSSCLHTLARSKGRFPISTRP